MPSRMKFKELGDSNWSSYVPLFLISLIILSCGYRFQPSGEHIDKEIKRVFVESFINNTSEAHLENTFRSAFIDQFIKGRRFTIVGNADAADAVFRGTINILTTTPLAYKKNNLATEERVTIIMDLAFEQKGKSKIIWTHSAFSGVQDYVFNDLTSREENRKGALLKLSNDFAEKAYNLMMSGF